MTLMGTAVKMEKGTPPSSGTQPEIPTADEEEEDEEGISVKIDGVVTKWTPPPASPSLEALKKNENSMDLGRVLNPPLYN